MKTHGHKTGGVASPTYRIWLGMKRRCHDSGFKDFAKYGAKGITICPRWDKSFQNFLDDMGERPSLDHSIDRKNPKGNYEPDNCRWATSFQQGSENKSNLRGVVVKGERFQSLAAACRKYGVGRTTLNERLARGIDIETAIITPTRRLVNKRTRESYWPKHKRP